MSPLLRHGSSTLPKGVVFCARLTCRPWIKLSTATIATLDTPRITIPSLGSQEPCWFPPCGSLSNLNTTLSEGALHFQVVIPNLQRSLRKQHRLSYFFRNCQLSRLFFNLFTTLPTSPTSETIIFECQQHRPSLKHHGPNNGKAHRRRGRPIARQPHQAHQLLHRAFPSLLQVQ